MEDILASIRRILSEDDAPAPSSEPPAHEHPPEPDSEDVLFLDPAMMVPEPTPATIPEEAKMTGPSDQPHAFRPEGSPAPVPASAADNSSQAGSASVPTPGKSGLVAPSAAAAAAASVDSLVRTLTNRGTRTHTNGPTIEEIVREEIRPLLKAWLDENLPALVERQVRLEIERVVNHVVL
jgi:hypothetical protein